MISHLEQEVCGTTLGALHKVALSEGYLGYVVHVKIINVIFSVSFSFLRLKDVKLGRGTHSAFEPFPSVS